jgi:uncharacterized cofD-like protein
MKAVAFGGGHGLKASLNALLLIDASVSAVVVVSDDGGSSGRIRNSYSVLPPGDLRMAFETLTQDESWSELLGHRFGGNSELTGHALGNLMLLALFEKYSDPQIALKEFANLVRARGEVLPMSISALKLEADLLLNGSISQLTGQVAIASSAGEITNLRLKPEHPTASPAALEKINEAELLVFGPGSWWTSVIPHFLLPEIKSAIANSKATKIVINNLVPEKGETDNFLPATFLKVLKEVAKDIKFDYVINEASVINDSTQLDEAVASLGAISVVADVIGVSSSHSGKGNMHDPKKLAEVFQQLITNGRK